jgi:phage I-like protein
MRKVILMVDDCRAVSGRLLEALRQVGIEPVVPCLNAEENGDEVRMIALNFELPADGSLPAELMLIPPGKTITGRDGRTYRNSEPGRVVSWFDGRGVDLCFDYLHATELKAPKGEEAPASGWGKHGSMTVKEDGSLWVNVEWTPRATEAVKNREYRYISPVYLCTADMEIRGISSVGLTNKPNVFIPALNGEIPSPAGTKGEEKMTYEEFLKKMALLCGLPETATAEQILAACEKMKGDCTTAQANAENPPVSRFIPRGDYDAVLLRATNAEKSLSDRDAETLKKEANAEIDAAVAAGKITPGTKEYYLKQCNTQEGLAEFKTFVGAAPVVAAPSNLDGKEVPGSVQLNQELTDMAGVFGNSAEDLKKYGGVK